MTILMHMQKPFHQVVCWKISIRQEILYSDDGNTINIYEIDHRMIMKILN